MINAEPEKRSDRPLSTGGLDLEWLLANRLLAAASRLAEVLEFEIFLSRLALLLRYTCTRISLRPLRLAVISDALAESDDRKLSFRLDSFPLKVLVT